MPPLSTYVWLRMLPLAGAAAGVMATVGAYAAAGGPIRPLAQDFVVLAESPEPRTIYLRTPTVLRLASGRLLAGYEVSAAGRKPGEPYAFIHSSDDGGRTWTRRGPGTDMTFGRLFQTDSGIYYFGQRGDLRVTRSIDNGETWSPAVNLTAKQSWHQSACNVWHTKDHVYLVMERRVANRSSKAWGVGELAPVLLRASRTADLTKRESWTFASELAFQDVIPGFRENKLETDFFGVPFFQPDFPNRARLPGGRGMTPLGWLETNVIQITDPDHVWHDPTGHTFHLFMRAHTGGSGYAALAKVVENADGSMTTQLEKAPSGKTMLYLPFPGGQMRFHICYDEPTKLYWLLGSQATDSMRRTDRMPADRYDLPNNERHRLVLHFSRNMVDWCFAGLVAEGASPRESRHYASMDIDGDDLVILSRSGDARAKSAHDGNLITFHRVKNFRDLVY